MLSEILNERLIRTNLSAKSREDALNSLLEIMNVDEMVKGLLFNLLLGREKLGSTGIGKGIAIPHCRSLLLHKMSVAVGIFPDGVEFDAVDKKPVYLFFLVTAPPRDKGNQYLLTLGEIAKLAKSLRKTDSLFQAEDAGEFLSKLKVIEKR